MSVGVVASYLLLAACLAAVFLVVHVLERWGEGERDDGADDDDGGEL